MEFKGTIEKLRADNWPRWKRQMVLLLRHHRVDNVVLNRTVQNGEENIGEGSKVMEEFTKEDSLAQLILVSSFDDHHCDLTATCATAQDIWLKLCSVYEQSSGQRLDRLMEAFFKYEKNVEEDISTHVSKLEKLFHEMNEELRSLEEHELPMMLLMSRIMSTLPEDFFEFKSVWESVPVPERTINNLIERLRLIEMRLPGSSKNIEALSGANKPDRRKTEQKFQRGPRCFKCHKIGHIAKFCTEENGNAFVVISSLVSDKMASKWIADSGASVHMTSQKSSFCMFKPFMVPIPIQVGNGEIIEAVGEGTINIEIYRGYDWVRGALENVWYVPKLKRNLMSIGQTVSKGYTFRANGNSCCFLDKGNVVMTGLKSNNGLFEMKMRVVTVGVESYSTEKILSIQEWHEKLAHQNKQHVEKVLKNMGINFHKKEFFCKGCIEGKTSRKPFKPRKEI